MPRSAPLWLRARCASIYHLGGVHSGAGVCATAWMLASTLRSTVAYARRVSPFQRGSGDDSAATLALSWMLCLLCCAIICFAWPSFRKRYHNCFEQLHRFLGWTALALFWARTLLSVWDATPAGADLGLALIRRPAFWLLGAATCSIASSWLFLRRVPVEALPLSEHAVTLRFRYAVPVNGSFVRLSTRPLLEWHSFATIPEPHEEADEKQQHEKHEPGFSLIVSNAGDWTRACIQRPPSSIWVRGVPTCGVMRVATLFRRVVLIATGSAIGPMLGHIRRPSCPTQLIWSTPSPEWKFGKGIIDTIYELVPQAVIHNTRIKGRPDLVRMGYNLVRSFDAEAFIIANEKITKKVVYGLQTRGLPAYGAIWDS